MNNLDKKITLANEVLKLSIEISTNSIIDCFVNFSSHVQLLDIKVMLKGWNSDNYEVDYEKKVYLDWKDSEKELQAIVDYLKNLKEVFNGGM